MNFYHGPLTVILLTTPMVTFAVDSTNDDVRLINNFFVDAATPTSAYAAGAFAYADYDNGSAIALGSRGGAPYNNKIDIGAQWVYSNNNFDNNAEASGLGPLELNARYKLHFPDSPVNVSAVGIITLPIGADEVGGDQFNFGASVATRYPAQDNLVFTANLGLFSIDYPVDREISVHLGAGTIFQLEPGISLIGELAIKTEEDYSVINAGADIQFTSNMRLRPSIAVGFDDGTADLAISAELLIFLL